MQNRHGICNSPTATPPTLRIGKGSRIGAGSRIGTGSHIGTGMCRDREIENSSTFIANIPNLV